METIKDHMAETVEGLNQETSPTGTDISPIQPKKQGHTRRFFLKSTAALIAGTALNFFVKPNIEKEVSPQKETGPKKYFVDSVIGAAKAEAAGMGRTPERFIVEDPFEKPQPKPVTPEVKNRPAPTKIFINPQLPEVYKANADKIAVVAANVLSELGLNGLVAKIEFVDPTDPRLKPYDKNDQLKGMGVGGIFDDTTNTILLRANLEESDIRSVVLPHELTHAVEPRFGIVTKYLNPEEQQELEQKSRKAALAFRQNNLIGGKSVTWYDRSILWDVYRKMGKGAQERFAKSIGLPQFVGRDIPTAELQRAISLPIPDYYKQIINAYLNDQKGQADQQKSQDKQEGGLVCVACATVAAQSPEATQGSNMTEEALGQKIAQRFWRDGLANITDILGENTFKYVDALQEAESRALIEASAELGRDYLLKTPSLSTNYPEFYEVFDYIFPLLRSKLS